MSILTERGFKPKPAEIESRRAFIHTLANFASRFNEDDFLGDEFNGLSPSELGSLGNEILIQEDVFEGYRLIAGVPIDGNGTYYDRIIGPQHRKEHGVLRKIIERFEFLPVEKALDIAAGTGESSILLTSVTNSITAVDYSLPLIAVANRKLEELSYSGLISSYETEVMDATNLTFPDNTFDIVINHALIAYLNREEMPDFWQGILRVLKPEGRYYSFFAEGANFEIYESTLRAQLAGEVAAALFSFTNMEDQRSKPLNLYPESYGFEGEVYEISSVPYKQVVLRWIKPAQVDKIINTHN